MVSRKQFHNVARAAALCAVAIMSLATPGAGDSGAVTAPKKFYADDPLLREPPPRPVKAIAKLDVDEVYDFLTNSLITPRRISKADRRAPHPAANINTLGEVPDSPWYTNRHFYHRMSIEELKRGPGNETPPSSKGTWRVISAKSDGIMPGFVFEDQEKNRYLLKLDPPQYPELASAADVIGSKAFYALGYNAPENYIVRFRREKLEISAGVKWRDSTGTKRPLTERVLNEMLKPQPKSADGTYRGMASRWVPGEVIGPFTYQGTRSDDPNDIVEHEDRRELRAMRVFASWLNHTDAKSINTLDSLVTENGTPYVKHYLVDFGSILGSAGTDPKLPWYGHEYVIDPKGTAVQMATFGLYTRRWMRSDYPKLTGVGLFDSWSFNPATWKSDYPNPAFLLMDREDAFWAAKQVAAFSDDEIRALVQTGEFTDPRATDWIADCLIKRRDKIAETWFAPVLPLDKFRVSDGELGFDDLAATRAGGTARPYRLQWAKYDQQGHVTPLPNATGRQVPDFNGTEYLTATISCGAGSGDACPEPVTVYLRRAASRVEVVGIDH